VVGIRGIGYGYEEIYEEGIRRGGVFLMIFAGFEVISWCITFVIYVQLAFI
jgi:hypothetical protein